MNSIERENASDVEEKFKKEGEPWLDQEREKSYQELLGNLEIIEKEGGNKAIQHTFAQILNVEAKDIKSLKYIIVESLSASEVAGKKIDRPVFIFSDISEFQKFSKKMQGESGMSSSGMVMSLSGEIPLIIATPGKGFISHEVRHTIDPNLNKRERENNILEELFAYYQEIIIEAKLDQYSHIKNPEDGPWNKLISAVGLDIYHEKIKGDTDLSIKQYKEKTKETVEALRLIAQKHGHIEAQRAILKSKTIDEFIVMSKL